MCCRSLLLLSLLALPAVGQHAVSPGRANHHVFAVVPIIGTGRPGDPKRPMFVPSDAQLAALPRGTRPPILSYHMQVSDDGNYALVEFVGATPSDLSFIVTSN